RLKSSAHSVYGRWQGWCCRRCGSIGVRFRPLIWALFFPVTAPPETSTLSLHDALPICGDTDDAILDEAEALAKLVGRRATSFTVDRKSTRLNSSHEWISYAVFCLKKKNRSVRGGIPVVHSREMFTLLRAKGFDVRYDEV